MIATLVKKDFLTNLVAPRFVIGFVLCLVLIPFSILINVSGYREREAQYRLDRDAAEKDAAGVRVYSFLRPEIVLPPEPLGVFGKGVSDQVGNRVRILLGDKPLLAEGKTAAGDNPFLASFFSVDFVDIAAIVFSLLALLFSYDAFSREKEDGTLKLQMSNALSRSTALAGKLLGILTTLLPILVFSFLLSALLILFSRDISFSAGDWGRIVLLFAASLVYLAVFVFIGLLVSTRSRSSVTSLVVCLFLWVLLVFVVPVVAANFAESFVGVASRDNLDRVLRDIDKERDAAISAAFKAQGVPEGWNCWWCSGGTTAPSRPTAIPGPNSRISGGGPRSPSPSGSISPTGNGPRPRPISTAWPGRRARRTGSPSCPPPGCSGRSPRPFAGRTWPRTSVTWTGRGNTGRPSSAGSKASTSSRRSAGSHRPTRPLSGPRTSSSRCGRAANSRPRPSSRPGPPSRRMPGPAWLKVSQVKVAGDSPADFPYLDRLGHAPLRGPGRSALLRA